MATAVVFLYSSLAAPLAEANFWEERRRATSAAHAGDPARAEGTAAERRSNDDWFASAEPGLRVPHDAGAVTSVFRGDPAKPLVIHLQDAHGLYSAQKSAVQILRHLQANQKVRWIGVEGAWQRVSQDWLAAFPDQAVKEQVAQEYFDRGDLNGEEYLALVQPAGTWTLVGVEDETPYRRNLAMREDTAAFRLQAQDYFDRVDSRLRKLKSRAYPPSLHEAERFAAAYHARQLSFAPFADKLLRLSARLQDPAVRRRELPMLSRALDLLLEESALSLDAVDRERSELVEAAGRELEEKELQALLERTLSFRTGLESPRAYHETLLRLARRLARPAPELERYAAYLARYESVDQKDLERDIRRLEASVWKELAGGDAGTLRLGAVSRWAGLQRKLWALELTPEDSALYEESGDALDWTAFSAALRDLETRLDPSAAPVPSPGAWIALQAKVEDYYRLAEARNDHLVENALRAMRDDGVQVGVLIAGGYHTPGLTERFRKRGVSYAVVRPRITDEPRPAAGQMARGEREWRENLRQVVGALRDTLNLQRRSFQTEMATNFMVRALFSANPSEAPAFFERIWTEWSARSGGAEELRSIDFSPVVLRRGQGAKEERFVVARVTGAKGTALPAVYRLAAGKVPALAAQGEEAVREFLRAGRWSSAPWEVEYAEDKFTSWGLLGSSGRFDPRAWAEGVRQTLAYRRFVAEAAETKTFLQRPPVADSNPSVPVLLEALKDGNDLVRRQAAGLLRLSLDPQMEDPRVAATLAALLESPEATASLAADLLADQGPRAVAAAAPLLAQDKPLLARRRAAQVLSQVAARGVALEPGLAKAVEGLLADTEAAAEAGGVWAMARGYALRQAARSAANFAFLKVLPWAGWAAAVAAVLLGQASPALLAIMAASHAAGKLLPEQRWIPMAAMGLGLVALSGSLQVLPFLALSAAAFWALRRGMNRVPAWARPLILAPVFLMSFSSAAQAAQIVLGQGRQYWIWNLSKKDLMDAGQITADTPAAEANRLIQDRVNDYTEVMRAQDPNWDPSRVTAGDTVQVPPIEGAAAVTPVAQVLPQPLPLDTPALPTDADVTPDATLASFQTAAPDSLVLTPNAFASVTDGEAPNFDLIPYLPWLLALAALSGLGIWVYRRYARRRDAPKTPAEEQTGEPAWAQQNLKEAVANTPLEKEPEWTATDQEEPSDDSSPMATTEDTPPWVKKRIKKGSPDASSTQKIRKGQPADVEDDPAWAKDLRETRLEVPEEEKDPAWTDAALPVGTQLSLFGDHQRPAEEKAEPEAEGTPSPRKRKDEKAQLSLDFDAKVPLRAPVPVALPEKLPETAAPEQDDGALLEFLRNADADQIRELFKDAKVVLPAKTAQALHDFVRQSAPKTAAEVIAAHLGIGRKSWNVLAKFLSAHPRQPEAVPPVAPEPPAVAETAAKVTEEIVEAVTPALVDAVVNAAPPDEAKEPAAKPKKKRKEKTAAVKAAEATAAEVVEAVPPLVPQNVVETVAAVVAPEAPAVETPIEVPPQPTEEETAPSLIRQAAETAAAVTEEAAAPLEAVAEPILRTAEEASNRRLMARLATTRDYQVSKKAALEKIEKEIRDLQDFVFQLTLRHFEASPEWPELLEETRRELDRQFADARAGYETRKRAAGAAGLGEKGLSLINPWGPMFFAESFRESLAKAPLKQIETRGRDLTGGWRGPVHFVTSQQTPQANSDAREAYAHFGVKAEALPHGQEIGTAELFDVVEFTPDAKGFARWIILKDHPEYGHRVFFPWVPAWGARYGLVFTNPQALEEPKPAKGALGLFDWNPPAEEGATAEPAASRTAAEIDEAADASRADWDEFVKDWTARHESVQSRQKALYQRTLRQMRAMAQSKGLESGEAKAELRDAISLLQTAGAGVQRTLHDIVAGVRGRMQKIVGERFLVGLSEQGFVKRTPLTADQYRARKGAGPGMYGMRMPEKGGDAVRAIAVVSPGETLLAFTNQGRVYLLDPSKINAADADARGKQKIEDLLTLQDGESVTALTSISDFAGDRYAVLATRNGNIRRLALKDLKPRSGEGGKDVVELTGSDDALLSVAITDGSQEIVLASRSGAAFRLPESDIPVHKTQVTQGVAGIGLTDADSLIAMETIAPKDGLSIFLLSEDGHGKRVRADKIPVYGRGARGVRVTPKGTNLSALLRVAEDDDIVAMTVKGKLIRRPASSVPLHQTLATEGARFIEPKDNDHVSAATSIRSGKNFSARVVSEDQWAEWSKALEELAGESAAAGQEAAGLLRERIEKARARVFPEEETPRQVISIRQGQARWADLILEERKQIETREWKDSTVIGKMIYLHVPKRKGQLHGRIIGQFRVVDVVDISQPDVFEGLKDLHMVFGYEFGKRFGYVLAEVDRFIEPMPYPGGQRFFDFDAATAEKALLEEKDYQEAQGEQEPGEEAPEESEGAAPAGEKEEGEEERFPALSDEIRDAMRSLNELENIRAATKNEYLLLSVLEDHLKTVAEKVSAPDVEAMDRALIGLMEAGTSKDAAKISAAEKALHALAAANPANWEYLEPVLAAWGLTEERIAGILGERPRSLDPEQSLADALRESLGRRVRDTAPAEPTVHYEALEVLRLPRMQTYTPVRDLRVLVEGQPQPLTFRGKPAEKLHVRLGGKDLPLNDQAEEVALLALGFLMPMKDNDPDNIDEKRVPDERSQKNLLFGATMLDSDEKMAGMPTLVEIFRASGVDLPADVRFYKDGRITEPFREIAEFVTLQRKLKKDLVKPAKADKTPNVRVVPKKDDEDEAAGETPEELLYVSFNNAESLGRWGIYRAHTRPNLHGQLRRPLELSELRLNASKVPEGWPAGPENLEFDAGKLQVLSWEHPVTHQRKGIRLGSAFATKQDIKKYLKVDLLGASVKDVLDGAWETREAWERYNPHYLDRESYGHYVSEVKAKVRDMLDGRTPDASLRVIDLIREHAARMILSSNPQDQQVGVVFYLMDTMHARIGGDASNDSEAVGITKWLKAHLDFDDARSAVKWKFTGKSGILWQDEREITSPAKYEDAAIEPAKYQDARFYTPEVNAAVYAILKKRAALQNASPAPPAADVLRQGAGAEEQIFSATDEDVNRFLKQFGPFTAKLTRPFLAGLYAQRQLAAAGPMAGRTPADAREIMETMYAYVGNLLGHRRIDKETGAQEVTGATARVNYVDPRLVARWAPADLRSSGELRKRPDLNAEYTSRGVPIRLPPEEEKKVKADFLEAIGLEQEVIEETAKKITTMRQAFVQAYLEADAEGRGDLGEALRELKQLHPLFEDKLTVGGSLLYKIQLLERLGLAGEEILASGFQIGKMKALIGQRAKASTLTAPAREILAKIKAADMALWLRITNNGKYLGEEVDAATVSKVLGEGKAARAARIASDLTKKAAAKALAPAAGAVKKAVESVTTPPAAAETKEKPAKAAPGKQTVQTPPAPVTKAPEPVRPAVNAAVFMAARATDEGVEVFTHEQVMKDVLSHPKRRLLYAVALLHEVLAAAGLSHERIVEAGFDPLKFDPAPDLTVESLIQKAAQLLKKDEAPAAPGTTEGSEALARLEAQRERLEGLKKEEAPASEALARLLAQRERLAALKRATTAAPAPARTAFPHFDLGPAVARWTNLDRKLVRALLNSLRNTGALSDARLAELGLLKDKRVAVSDAWPRALDNIAFVADFESVSSVLEAAGLRVLAAGEDLASLAGGEIAGIHLVEGSAEGVDAAEFIVSTADGHLLLHAELWDRLRGNPRARDVVAHHSDALARLGGLMFDKQPVTPAVLAAAREASGLAAISGLLKPSAPGASRRAAVEDLLRRAREAKGTTETPSLFGRLLDYLPLIEAALLQKRWAKKVADAFGAELPDLLILPATTHRLVFDAIRNKKAAPKTIQAEKRAASGKDALANLVQESVNRLIDAKVSFAGIKGIEVVRGPPVEGVTDLFVTWTDDGYVLAHEDFLHFWDADILDAALEQEAFEYGQYTTRYEQLRGEDKKPAEIDAILAKELQVWHARSYDALLARLDEKIAAERARLQKAPAKPAKAKKKADPNKKEIASLRKELQAAAAAREEIADELKAVEERLEQLRGEREDLGTAKPAPSAAAAGSAFFTKIEIVRGAPEMPLMTTKEGTLLIPEFLVEKWIEQEKLAPKDATGYSLAERVTRELLQQDFRTQLAQKIQALGPKAAQADREKAAAELAASHPVQKLTPPMVVSMPAQARTNRDEATKIARRLLRDYHEHGSALDGVLILSPTREQAELIAKTVTDTLKDREAVKDSLSAALKEAQEKRASKYPNGDAGLKGASKGAYTRLVNKIQAVQEALDGVDDDPALEEKALSAAAAGKSRTFAERAKEKAETAPMLLISLVNDYADPLRALAGKRIRVGYYARAFYTPDADKGYFRYILHMPDRSSLQRSQAGRTPLGMMVEEELHISPIEGQVRHEEIKQNEFRNLYPERFDWGNLEVFEDGAWKRVQLEVLPAVEARNLEEYQGLKSVLEAQGKGIWNNTRIYGNHSLLLRMEVADLLTGRGALAQVSDLAGLGREWFLDPALLRAVDWTAAANATVLKAVATALGVKAKSVEELAEAAGAALQPVILPKTAFESLAKLIPVETQRGELKGVEIPKPDAEKALKDYSAAFTAAPAAKAEAAADDGKEAAELDAAIAEAEDEKDDIEGRLQEAERELARIRGRLEELGATPDISAFGEEKFLSEVWFPIVDELGRFWKVQAGVFRAFRESLRGLKLGGLADALEAPGALDKLREVLSFAALPREAILLVLRAAGFELREEVEDADLAEVRRKIEAALGKTIALRVVGDKPGAPAPTLTEVPADLLPGEAANDQKPAGTAVEPPDAPKKFKGGARKVFDAVWKIVPSGLTQDAVRALEIPLIQTVGTLLREDFPDLAPMALNGIVADALRSGAEGKESPMPLDQAATRMKDFVEEFARRAAAKSASLKAANRKAAERELIRSFRDYLERRFAQDLLARAGEKDPLAAAMPSLRAQTAGMPELLKQAGTYVLNEWEKAVAETVRGLNPESTPSLFQLVGYRRLLDKPRALLADVMGTGKTLQTLLALFNAPDVDDVLLVTPLGGVDTWVDEAIKRLAGPRDIVVLAQNYPSIPSVGDYTFTHKTGADAVDYVEKWVAEKKSGAAKATGRKRFVVVNYDHLKLLEEKRPGILDKLKPGALVVDEAHNIKNIRDDVLRTKVVRKIKSPRLVLVTGTPIENVAEDAQIYLRMVFEDKKVEAEAFKDSPFRDFEAFWTAYAANAHRPEYQAELNRILNKITIRRESRDVMVGLPDRRDVNYVLDLQQGTLEAWEGDRRRREPVALPGVFEVQHRLIEWLLGHTWGDKGRAPLPDEDTRSLKRLWGADFERWSSFFEDLVKTNEAFAKVLPKDNGGSLTTRVSQAFLDPELLGLKTDSIKFTALKLLVEEKLQAGEQIILYSQYKEVTRKMRSLFPGAAYMDGDTPLKKRIDEVQRFQNGDARIFVATIDTASESINLNRAASVIHFDKPWKPSTLNQGAARPYRWGNENAYLELGSLVVKYGKSLTPAPTPLLGMLGDPIAGSDAHVEEILHEKLEEEARTLQNGFPLTWPAPVVPIEAKPVNDNAVKRKARSVAPAMEIVPETDFAALAAKIQVERVPRDTEGWNDIKKGIESVRSSRVGRKFPIKSLKKDMLAKGNILLLVKYEGRIVGYALGIPAASAGRRLALPADVEAGTALLVEDVHHVRVPPQVQQELHKRLREAMEGAAQSLGFKTLLRLATQLQAADDKGQDAVLTVGGRETVPALVTLTPEEWAERVERLAELMQAGDRLKEEVLLTLSRLGYGELAEALDADATFENVRKVLDFDRPAELTLRLLEFLGYRRLITVEDKSSGAVRETLEKDAPFGHFIRKAAQYRLGGRPVDLVDALRCLMAAAELHPEEQAVWLHMAEVLDQLRLTDSRRRAARFAFDSEAPALKDFFDQVRREIREVHPNDDFLEIRDYLRPVPLEEMEARPKLSREQREALALVRGLRGGKKDLNKVATHLELTAAGLPSDVAVDILLFLDGTRRTGRGVPSVSALKDAAPGMTSARLADMLDAFYVEGAEIADEIFRARLEKDAAKRKFDDIQKAQRDLEPVDPNAESDARDRHDRAVKREAAARKLTPAYDLLRNQALWDKASAAKTGFVTWLVDKGEPVTRMGRDLARMFAPKEEAPAAPKAPAIGAGEARRLKQRLAPAFKAYVEFAGFVKAKNYRLPPEEMSRWMDSLDEKVLDEVEDMEKAQPGLLAELLQTLDVVLFYAHGNGRAAALEPLSRLAAAHARLVAEGDRTPRQPDMPDFHPERAAGTEWTRDIKTTLAEKAGRGKLNKWQRAKWTRVKSLIVDSFPSEEADRRMVDRLKHIQFLRDNKSNPAATPWADSVGGRLAYVGAFVDGSGSLMVRSHLLKILSEEDLAELIIAALREDSAPADGPAVRVQAPSEPDEEEEEGAEDEDKDDEESDEGAQDQDADEATDGIPGPEDAEDASIGFGSTEGSKVSLRAKLEKIAYLETQGIHFKHIQPDLLQIPLMDLAQVVEELLAEKRPEITQSDIRSRWRSLLERRQKPTTADYSAAVLGRVIVNRLNEGDPSTALPADVLAELAERSSFIRVFAYGLSEERLRHLLDAPEADLSPIERALRGRLSLPARAMDWARILLSLDDMIQGQERSGIDYLPGQFARLRELAKAASELDRLDPAGLGTLLYQRALLRLNLTAFQVKYGLFSGEYGAQASDRGLRETLLNLSTFSWDPDDGYHEYGGHRKGGFTKYPVNFGLNENDLLLDLTATQHGAFHQIAALEAQPGFYAELDDGMHAPTPAGTPVPVDPSGLLRILPQGGTKFREDVTLMGASHNDGLVLAFLATLNGYDVPQLMEGLSRLAAEPDAFRAETIKLSRELLKPLGDLSAGNNWNDLLNTIAGLSIAQAQDKRKQIETFRKKLRNLRKNTRAEIARLEKRVAGLQQKLAQNASDAKARTDLDKLTAKLRALPALRARQRALLEERIAGAAFRAFKDAYTLPTPREEAEGRGIPSVFQIGAALTYPAVLDRLAGRFRKFQEGKHELKLDTYARGPRRTGFDYYYAQGDPLRMQFLAHVLFRLPQDKLATGTAAIGGVDPATAVSVLRAIPRDPEALLAPLDPREREALLKRIGGEAAWNAFLESIKPWDPLESTCRHASLSIL